MSQTDKKIKAEETLLFMGILTFIGGFLNAYSYFLLGGAFVTFHTGNIAKVGLSLLTQDSAMFVACSVPILGGLLGSVIAQFVKVHLAKRPPLFWQKATLVLELVCFLVVGLLPASVPSAAINFLLSVVSMFQLSNFRKYEGNVHNSTIETGNLRYFGQQFADTLMKRDKATLIPTLRYFLLLCSFPIGVVAGGLACGFAGRYAVWACSALLAVSAFLLLPSSDPAAQS